MHVCKCEKYCECSKKSGIRTVHKQRDTRHNRNNTVLDKTEDDSELALDGYRLFRKNRENQKAEGHLAGGVLLYVKSSLKAVER